MKMTNDEYNLLMELLDFNRDCQDGRVEAGEITNEEYDANIALIESLEHKLDANVLLIEE